MLVCIPTNDDRGANAALCDHFGSAPYFTLYDSEADRISVVPNTNAHHSHGTCHPLTMLASLNIDAVVCRGMGRRAIDTMNQQGIRVCRASGKLAGEAIESVKSGTLTEIPIREACAGHSGRRLRAGEGGCDGSGPGHGHSQGGGGGRGH